LLSHDCAGFDHYDFLQERELSGHAVRPYIRTALHHAQAHFPFDLLKQAPDDVAGSSVQEAQEKITQFRHAVEKEAQDTLNKHFICLDEQYNCWEI
jgi:hypothetical protein